MKTDFSKRAVRRVLPVDISATHARFAIPADRLMRDDARLPVADDRGVAAARRAHLAQFAASTIRNLNHE